MPDLRHVQESSTLVSHLATGVHHQLTVILAYDCRWKRHNSPNDHHSVDVLGWHEVHPGLECGFVHLTGHSTDPASLELRLRNDRDESLSIEVSCTQPLSDLLFAFWVTARKLPDTIANIIDWTHPRIDSELAHNLVKTNRLAMEWDVLDFAEVVAELLARSWSHHPLDPHLRQRIFTSVDDYPKDDTLAILAMQEFLVENDLFVPHACGHNQIALIADIAWNLFISDTVQFFGQTQGPTKGRWDELLHVTYGHMLEHTNHDPPLSSHNLWLESGLRLQLLDESEM